MIKKIFYLSIFCLTIFFGSPEVAAEDLRFIDSNGDTGYYIDMDSVKKIDGSAFTVDFIVIRADRNEMTIADLKINYALKTYTVQSEKTLSYDERTEISADNRQHITKSYSDKSVMNIIVQMILSE